MGTLPDAKSMALKNLQALAAVNARPLEENVRTVEATVQTVDEIETLGEEMLIQLMEQHGIKQAEWKEPKLSFRDSAGKIFKEGGREPDPDKMRFPVVMTFTFTRRKGKGTPTKAKVVAASPRSSEKQRPDAALKHLQQMQQQMQSESANLPPQNAALMNLHQIQKKQEPAKESPTAALQHLHQIKQQQQQEPIRESKSVALKNLQQIKKKSQQEPAKESQKASALQNLQQIKHNQGLAKESPRGPALEHLQTLDREQSEELVKGSQECAALGHLQKLQEQQRQEEIVRKSEEEVQQENLAKESQQGATLAHLQALQHRQQEPAKESQESVASEHLQALQEQTEKDQELVNEQQQQEEEAEPVKALESFALKHLQTLQTKQETAQVSQESIALGHLQSLQQRRQEEPVEQVQDQKTQEDEKEALAVPQERAALAHLQSLQQQEEPAKETTQDTAMEHLQKLQLQQQEEHSANEPHPSAVDQKEAQEAQQQQQQQQQPSQKANTQRDAPASAATAQEAEPQTKEDEPEGSSMEVQADTMAEATERKRKHDGEASVPTKAQGDQQPEEVVQQQQPKKTRSEEFEVSASDASPRSHKQAVTKANLPPQKVDLECFFAFAQCSLRVEAREHMGKDFKFADPEAEKMWPTYEPLAMRNLGKSEKWVPWHTVLGVHEIFLVREVHHKKNTWWTDYHRFVSMFIFRVHCKSDLFKEVMIPHLTKKAFWQNLEAGFSPGSQMERDIMAFRKQGRRLQTGCFLIIPERLLADDDENLVRNILLRSQRLIHCANDLWPVVQDTSTTSVEKYDLITRRMHEVKGLGETWVKMLMVCIDICMPHLRLLHDRCEVGVGAADPMRKLLEDEGLLSPKAPRPQREAQPKVQTVDGVGVYPMIKQGYISVRRDNKQLIQITRGMAGGSLDRAHAIAEELAKLVVTNKWGSENQASLIEARLNMLDDPNIAVSDLGLDVKMEELVAKKGEEDAAAYEQRCSRGPEQTPSQALASLCARINSSESASAQHFWNYLAQVEAHGKKYFANKNQSLVVAQMATEQNKLSAVTLQVQLCEFRQYQNYLHRPNLKRPLPADQ